MTGPYRGGTGGSGAGGAFAALGDATSDYFSKLNAYNQQNEQKRQFDANLLAQKEANEKTLELQERQQRFKEVEQFGSGISTMANFYTANQKYMDPEDAAVFGQMVQDGLTAEQAFYATNDQTGLSGHADKYGPGKAWGVDSAGRPINMDSVLAKVNANRPIKDLEEKLVTTMGDSQASFMASVLSDPNNPASDLVGSIARGEFKGSMQDAFALMYGSNKFGPKAALSALRRSKMTGSDLLIAKKVIDSLPESAYSTRGENGELILDEDYQTLQKLFESNGNPERMAQAQQAEDISGSQGAILEYNTGLFSLDVNKYQFARQQITDKRSDRASLGALVNEGDYATLKQPGTYQEYVRVFREENPDMPEEEIKAIYNADVAQAFQTDTQRRSIFASQATIAGNSALQSNMDTETKQITFDAIKPFLAGSVTQKAELEKVMTGNSMTSAQFTARILPQMLQLESDVQRMGMLQALASAPGGIGTHAIDAARDAGIINTDQHASLTAYAKDVKGLYDKGVDVQRITLSAEFQDQTVREQTASSMILLNVPRLTAERVAQEATTAGREALNRGLTAAGITEYAQRLGARGALAQLSQVDAARVTSEVQEAVQNALLKAGVPELQARAAVQELTTSISTNLLQQTQADATQPYVNELTTSNIQVQLSSDNLKLVQNDVANRIATAMVPFADEMGRTQATAEIQTSLASTAKSMVERYLSEGGLQYARQVGASGMQTQLSADSLARIRNDVQNAIASGTLPLAGKIGAAEAEAMLSKAIADTLTSQTTTDLLRGQSPYNFLTGQLTGQGNVAKARLDLANANATIDLLPAKMKAERSQYAALAATGRYDEALAILKTANVDWDKQLQDAATLQGLAGLDPKGQMASLIKNPVIKRMYQNAVTRTNQALEDADELARLRYGATGEGGEGGGMSTAQRRSFTSNKDMVESILKAPDIVAAMNIVKDYGGAKVTADAITGIATVTVPGDLTKYQPRVQAAWKAIDAAQKAAKPYRDNMEALLLASGPANASPNNTGNAPPRSYARNVPQTQVTGQGGTVVKRGGAAVPASGLPPQEITKQVTMTVDHYIGKINQQGTANPWDNAGGPVRAYNGMGPTLPNQMVYVNDIKAAYDARPWEAAIDQATGARKNELMFIDAEVDRIARAKKVSPGVIKAIMWNESVGWQAHIPSSDGKGGGLGQVTGYYAPKNTNFDWGSVPQVTPPSVKPPTQGTAAAPPVGQPNAPTGTAPATRPAAPPVGQPNAVVPTVAPPKPVAPKVTLPAPTSAAIGKAVPAFKLLPKNKGEYTVAAVALAKDLRGTNDGNYIQQRIQTFTLNAFGVKPGQAPTAAQQKDMMTFATELYDYIVPPAKPAPKPAPARPAAPPVTVRPVTITPPRTNYTPPSTGARTTGPAYRDPFAKPAPAAPAPVKPAPVKPAPAAAPKPAPAAMPPAQQPMFPPAGSTGGSWMNGGYQPAPGVQPFQGTMPTPSAAAQRGLDSTKPPAQKAISATTVAASIPAFKAVPKFRNELTIAAVDLAKQVRAENNPSSGLKRIEAFTRGAFNIPPDRQPTLQEIKDMNAFATQLYDYIYGGR